MMENPKENGLNMDKTTQCTELCIKIAEVFSNNVEISKYGPDALMRFFVILSKANGWSLEDIEKEAIVGIRYYWNLSE